MPAVPAPPLFRIKSSIWTTFPILYVIFFTGEHACEEILPHINGNVVRKWKISGHKVAVQRPHRRDAANNSLQYKSTTDYNQFNCRVFCTSRGSITRNRWGPVRQLCPPIFPMFLPRPAFPSGSAASPPWLLPLWACQLRAW